MLRWFGLMCRPYETNPFRILFFTDWDYKCCRNLLAASMPLCIEHRGDSLWLESVWAPSGRECGVDDPLDQRFIIDSRILSRGREIIDSCQ